MCGIAGILAYRESAPPVDADELLRIREHMITRGPDGARTWISPDSRIGLAHRRLAIIDSLRPRRVHRHYHQSPHPHRPLQASGPLPLIRASENVAGAMRAA